MEEKLKICFENLGIFVDDINDFELSTYIEDSMAFISLIVEIETEFSIEIGDEYLSVDRLRTAQDILEMINNSRKIKAF